MPRRKLSKIKDTAKQHILQKRAIEIPAILQLSNDCLCRIFKYLDLPELLIAGSVCKRFEGISQKFYKNYPYVNFEDLCTKLSEKRIRPRVSSIFKQLKSHLVSMQISDWNYNLDFNHARFSTSIFSNLQYLFLGQTFKIREKYANIFPALKYIVLEDIDLSHKNESIVNRWYKNSPNLKILKFLSIEDMTGKCLVGLKGIEELKIWNSKNIQEKFFEEFCQNNPQLKKLTFDLCFCNLMRNNTFLEIISKYLKNLEGLVIIEDDGKDPRYDTNYEKLRDFPNVTKLRLDVHDDKQESSGFNHLLEHFAANNHIEYLNLKPLHEDNLDILQQFPHLKVLKLTFLIIGFQMLQNFISCCETLEELHIPGCVIVSSVVLRELIRQFKSLKLLNVCECGEDINSSALMNIEECLHKREHMLEIAVNGTDLVDELQMEPKSKVLKKFLDRTKEKLKLTIDEYTTFGMAKKFFHEYEEWEGDVYPKEICN